MSARNIRSAVGNIYLLVVFGFRTAIVDGTRKERDCRSSLLEQDSISLFYCNSHTAILNPHQPQAKQSFAESFFARPAFSRKSGQFCVAQLRSRKSLAQVGFEQFATGGVAEAADSFLLDLAHSLAGEVELFADLFEGHL